MSYEVKYQTTVFETSPLHGVSIRSTRPVESIIFNPARQFHFFGTGYEHDLIVEVTPDNTIVHKIEGRDDTSKVIVMLPDNRYTFTDTIKEITFWLDVPQCR